jgi:hypothetical protein
MKYLVNLFLFFSGMRHWTRPPSTFKFHIAQVVGVMPQPSNSLALRRTESAENDKTCSLGNHLQAFRVAHLGSCLGRTGEELGPCQRARKTLRTTSCSPLHRQVLPATHCERAWKRLFRPALLTGNAAATTQRFPVDRRLSLSGDCSVTAGALSGTNCLKRRAFD